MFSDYFQNKKELTKDEQERCELLSSSLSDLVSIKKVSKHDRTCIASLVACVLEVPSKHDAGADNGVEVAWAELSRATPPADSTLPPSNTTSLSSPSSSSDQSWEYRFIVGLVAYLDLSDAKVHALQPLLARPTVTDAFVEALFGLAVPKSTPSPSRRLTAHKQLPPTSASSASVSFLAPPSPSSSPESSSLPSSTPSSSISSSVSNSSDSTSCSASPSPEDASTSDTEPEPRVCVSRWRASLFLRARVLATLLHFCFVHDGGYDARARRMLRAVCAAVDVDWNSVFLPLERRYGREMMRLAAETGVTALQSDGSGNTLLSPSSSAAAAAAAAAATTSAGADAAVENAKEQKSSKSKYAKWAKIGAVGLLGGALLAVTGGLAAPAIGVAIGTVGLTSAATFLSGSLGLMTVTAVFGLSGAGLTGYRMNRRIGDVEEFEFESLQNDSDDDDDGDEDGDKNDGDNDGGDDGGDNSNVKDAGSDDKARSGGGLRRFLPWRSSKSKQESSDDNDERRGKGCGGGGGDDGKLAVVVCVHGWLSKIDEDESASLRWQRAKVRRAVRLREDFNTAESDANTEVSSASSSSSSSSSKAKEIVTTGAKVVTKTAKLTVEAVTPDALMKPESVDYSSAFSYVADDAAASLDVFNLKWETHCLLPFGQGIEQLLQTQLVGAVTGEALKRTVLAGLLAAVAWPASLLSATAVIDNTYSVVMHRARHAGLLLGEFYFVSFRSDSLLVSFILCCSLLHALMQTLIITFNATAHSLFIADVLAARVHGRRPVTLIGYSMGARVIFYALEELARRRALSGGWQPVEETASDDECIDDADVAGSKNGKAGAVVGDASSDSVDSLNESFEHVGDVAVAITAAAGGKSDDDDDADGNDNDKQLDGDVDGLVFDVILLGAPITDDARRWRAVRRVVCGRLVNGYVASDWLLGLLYRGAQFATKVAGLAPVRVVGVENIDLADVVSGHREYSSSIDAILKHIHFEV
jgi:hypothetical protein